MSSKMGKIRTTTYVIDRYILYLGNKRKSQYDEVTSRKVLKTLKISQNGIPKRC